MRKFSVPCIISLLVAALYNIVDQIYIANADYLSSYAIVGGTDMLLAMSSLFDVSINDILSGKKLSDEEYRQATIGIVILAVFVTGFLLKEPLFGYINILLLVLVHGWRNNAMMTYVENNAYDGLGK